MNEINEDLKNCSNYGILSLKSKFHEPSKSTNSFYPQCKFCIRE